MDHNIWRSRYRTTGITSHIEVTRQRIEDLSRISEIRLECIDIGSRIWEWHKIQIQDLVTFAEKVRNCMSSCFSTSPREDLKLYLLV